MIVPQILLVSTLENLWRTAWRNYTLMLGLKVFKNYVRNYGNASSFSFQTETFSIEILLSNVLKNFNFG